MGISLSNKDYIAFTIKKKKEEKEGREKRHDYDVTADCNKTIIKGPRKRERKRGGKKKGGNENVRRAIATRPPQIDWHARGERRCGRTGCVRGAYVN